MKDLNYLNNSVLSNAIIFENLGATVMARAEIVLVEPEGLIEVIVGVRGL